jgi:hypothetical protein
VADGVDGSSAEQIVGGMDSGCHERELPTEQEHEEAQTQTKAGDGVVEEQAIPPISGKVTGISGHRRRIASYFSVEQGVGELDAGKAQDDGGMGIAHRVGERVVLAMHCDPLPWPHSGAGPDEHSTCHSDTGGEAKRAMRKAPMEIHRGHQEGDL